GIAGSRQVGQANICRTHTGVVQRLLEYLWLCRAHQRVTPWGSWYAPPVETPYFSQNWRPTGPRLRRRLQHHGRGALAQDWTIVAPIKGPTCFLAMAARRQHL